MDDADLGWIDEETEDGKQETEQEDSLEGIQGAMVELAIEGEFNPEG